MSTYSPYKGTTLTSLVYSTPIHASHLFGPALVCIHSVCVHPAYRRKVIHAHGVLYLKRMHASFSPPHRVLDIIWLRGLLFKFSGNILVSPVVSVGYECFQLHVRTLFSFSYFALRKYAAVESGSQAHRSTLSRQHVTSVLEGDHCIFHISLNLSPCLVLK